MSLQEYTPDWHMPKRRKALSLFPFLTKRGGLRPCPDLHYILDGRCGWMVRKSGMSLDQARGACVSAGYLQDQGQWSDRESDSTINDLLELIDAEDRGLKQYPAGQWPDEESPMSDDDDSAKRKPASRNDPATMTQQQYLAALRKLGLSPASKRTAAMLGLSVRQIQRLADGSQEVPATVALLIGMYRAHGLPE